MRNFSDSLPEGWLAFELSVLRRLQFRSVADPFAGEATTAAYLKRWGARVAANDPAQWAFTRARARVENNAGVLSESEVDEVLEDAYVPRHRLYNPSLRRWFGETDAWWFDNVRAAVEKLEPEQRALALDLGMAVGDYALSFDDETRELRQPLSRVFKRLWDAAPAPFDNRRRNAASNHDARDFVSREPADLLFLRLPRPSRRGARDSSWAWREEWVRGDGDFWDDFVGDCSCGTGSNTMEKLEIDPFLAMRPEHAVTVGAKQVEDAARKGVLTCPRCGRSHRIVRAAPRHLWAPLRGYQTRSKGRTGLMTFPTLVLQ